MLLFNKIRLLFVVVLALASFVFSQVEDSAPLASTTTVNCSAPTYDCARKDLIKTNNLNPPPSVTHGKNTIVTPSDFKLPIVRATDSSTLSNQTMTVTMSASNGDNIFNTNDTYLLVDSDGGWKYPISFNPSTMQVLNSSAWKVGRNQVRWAGSGSFSPNAACTSAGVRYVPSDQFTSFDAPNVCRSTDSNSGGRT